MRKFHMIFTGMICLAVAISCTYDESQPESEGCDYGEVVLELDCPQMDTKASVVDGDTKIVKEVFFAAYNEVGQLETVKQYLRSSRMSISLDKNREHTILAIVNKNSLADAMPARLEDALRIEALIGWEDMRLLGPPMAGMKICDKGASNVTIKVDRLVSRVELTIDTDWPENTSFSIKQVSVGNTNRRMSIFGNSKALSVEDLGTCDFYKDEEDFLPSTGDLSHGFYYLMENMQGDLLPDNTDPYLKNRESLQARGLANKSDLCSYMEIILDQEDTYGVSGERCFRFYLGHDNTSNFDVRRSTEYNITFRITSDGMNIRDNWKVDNTELTDSRELQFEKKETELIPGRVSYIKVNYSTNGIADTSYSSFGASDGWNFMNPDSALTIGPYEEGMGIRIIADPDKVTEGQRIPLRIGTFDMLHTDEATIVIPAPQ